MTKEITEESTQQEMRVLVREKRKKEGISLETLAEKVGVRAATLSDFENGKTAINHITLEKIFKELGFFTIDKVDYEFRQKMWDVSEECANILFEKGVDIDKISQVELYNLTGIDEVLKYENNTSDREVIDEDKSYDYFVTLIKFQLVFLRK